MLRCASPSEVRGAPSPSWKRRARALAGFAALVALGTAVGCDPDALGALRGERGGGTDVVPRGRVEEEPGPSLVATGPARAAMQQLAEATCARRQRCGQLTGAPEACVERLKMDLVSDINTGDCAEVHQARLARCVDAIAAEPCDGVATSVRRALRCRIGAFCSSDPR